MSEPEFDAAVSALAAQVGELSGAQILARLLGLLRRLEDGHAGIGPGPNNELNVAFPLKFYVFEEGTLVVSSAPVHAQFLGSQLLTPNAHRTAGGGGCRPRRDRRIPGCGVKASGRGVVARTGLRRHSCSVSYTKGGTVRNISRTYLRPVRLMSCQTEALVFPEFTAPQ
jgi:hypothetical protein